MNLSSITWQVTKNKAGLKGLVFELQSESRCKIAVGWRSIYGPTNVRLPIISVYSRRRSLNSMTYVVALRCLSAVQSPLSVDEQPFLNFDSFTF